MAENDVIQIDVMVDQARLKVDSDLLRLFAPELRLKLMANLRATATGVIAHAGEDVRHYATTHAKGKYAEDAAAGYKVQQIGGLLRLRNSTRGAAIIEFAGKKNPGGETPRGATLINTLNRRYGRPGRVLWHAFDQAAPIIAGTPVV